MIEKEIVLNQLYKQKIMPLISHSDASVCLKAIEACYHNGFKVIEFANRSENAFENFISIKKITDAKYPDMLLGMGTIITVKDAEKFYNAGALFMVAPILDEEVGKFCNEKNIVWVPGVATLTEIVKGHQMGAALVKLFPAGNIGGPAYIKSIKGPCPWINILPSGGVSMSQENLQSWFDTGVRCVSLSSDLFPKEMLNKGNYEEMFQRMELLKSILVKIK